MIRVATLSGGWGRHSPMPNPNPEINHMATTKKAAASNIRVPLQNITVSRDGKSVSLDIGKPFEFTAEEIEQIERANPDAISTQATVDTSTLDGKADL